MNVKGGEILGIGTRLKEIIDKKGTNVNQLAKTTDIPPMTIYSIIKRDNTKVDIDIMLKICKALGISVEELYQPNFNVKEVYIVFDDRLKRLRENKGYSMRQMAIALNLPYTTYVNYEQNKREPNSELLILMSKYFGVSIDYLMGRTEQSEISIKKDVDLTDHECDVITAYRNNPDMQPAVDKLLGVEKTTLIYRAAKSSDNHPAEIIETTKDFSKIPPTKRKL